MRTTLNIDDDLMIRAKVRAAEQRTTLTAVVEAALRDALQTRRTAPRTRIELPTWDGGGFPPGLDMSNNAAVRDFMDSLDERPTGPP